MADVWITIDGRRVKAAPRATLLSVCSAKGIDIPTLCFMEQMEPYAACRLCTVGLQRDGWVKYVTACNFPVDAGQRFETASPRVIAARRLIVESLLARCPDVEPLKRLAQRLGVRKVRFEPRESRDRCILCGLCVKVCSDVVAAHAIGFVGRGVDRTVGTPFSFMPESCIGCGACAAVCPTGAIEMQRRAVEGFKLAPGSERWCRYSRMGLARAAICPTSFECHRCEVEQYYAPRLQPHPVFHKALSPGDGDAQSE